MTGACAKPVRSEWLFALGFVTLGDLLPEICALDAARSANARPGVFEHLHKVRIAREHEGIQIVIFV